METHTIVNPLDLVFSNDATRTEVLSYLSLRQVQRLRSVSTSWRSHCEDYKRLFLLRLKTLPTKVLILELQSTKGKLLNGRIGTIQGKPTKQGRLPVGLTNWLTGEVESVTFKPCNLHPFFYQKEETMNCPEESLLNYTSNSKLSRSHGMILHQILGLARWACNLIKGSPFDGPYEEFLNLPSTHPFILRMNSAIFTWWTTPPSLANLPGLQGSILDICTRGLMLGDPHDTKKGLAQENKLWHQDGPQGVYMSRKFVQFMKSWGHERVTSGFWVARVYSTGTIMVQVDDPEDPTTSLGQVYLVKGHASVIGKDILRSLPAFCTTTLLPIYDCWTYDGLLRSRTFSDLAPDFEQQLDEHVDHAIHAKNVSWRGRSAEAGHWATAPPYPTIVQDMEDSIVLNWNGCDENANPNTTANQEEITSMHWKLGREIAQMAFDRGGIDASSDDTGLVLRRCGYSHQENPEGMCAVLYVRGHDEGISPTFAFPFQFQVGNDPSQIPTYTLEEALQAIFLFFHKQNALPFAAILHPDELSVVLPIETVLTQCFQEKGMEAPVVGWVRNKHHSGEERLTDTVLLSDSPPFSLFLQLPPPTTEEKILDTLRSRELQI